MAVTVTARLPSALRPDAEREGMAFGQQGWHEACVNALTATGDALQDDWLPFQLLSPDGDDVQRFRSGLVRQVEVNPLPAWSPACLAEAG